MVVLERFFFHRDLTHVYIVKGFPKSNYHFHLLTYIFLRTFKLYFLANFNYTIQSHQP